MNPSATMTKASEILTVDDDPDHGMILTDLLEREGYQVEIAQTGTEALHRVKSHHFDAIILDVGLPDRDGIMVLQDIVECDEKVPVILVTAFDSLERTVGPLDLQEAFAYLTKPYNREELKATIRRAIGVKSLAN